MPVHTTNRRRFQSFFTTKSCQATFQPLNAFLTLGKARNLVDVCTKEGRPRASQHKHLRARGEWIGIIGGEVPRLGNL